MSGSCRGLHKCIGRAYSPRLQSNSQVGSLRLRRAAQPVIPADWLRHPLNSNVGRLRKSHQEPGLKARKAADRSMLAGPKAGGLIHDARLNGGMSNPNERLPRPAVARKAARSESQNEGPAHATVCTNALVGLTRHGCNPTARLARFGRAVPPNPSFQRTGFAIR